MQRIFRRTVPIGVEHGTVGILAKDRTMYEVTTFRKDVETDGRHAVVAFALSIEEGTTEFDRKSLKIASTRFGEGIEEIVRGDAWGCMDITEPDAGSDMAALRAVGEQDADGTWTVSGQKIFITSGHGKYHFVIARTEKAEQADDPFAGLGGLSMFLVDADAPGISVKHLELLAPIPVGEIRFEVTPAVLLGEGVPAGEAWTFAWERNGRSWTATVALSGPKPELTLTRGDEAPEGGALEAAPVFRDEVIALAPLTSKADWDHWFEIMLVGHFSAGDVPAC